MEFLHVRARRIINEVKGSPFGFRYTINAYRGCSHACTYCFARPTHAYLGLDADRDFERRIVVKVNAVSHLRSELDPRRWAGELIAMGTNTDPYQRAEGKYRLTRGIVEVLTESANPFSILTKSTLVLRDLDLLAEAARRTAVRVNLSIGTLDEEVWRATEPGTPHPGPPGAGGRGAQRRRRPLRRAGRAGAARAVRPARPARGGGAGPASRPAPAPSRPCCCTCGRAWATCSCPGWPRPTRTWWTTTDAATATGPTPPGRPAGARRHASPRLVARHGGIAAEPADPVHMTGQPPPTPVDLRPGGRPSSSSSPRSRPTTSSSACCSGRGPSGPAAPRSWPRRPGRTTRPTARPR